MEANTLGTMGGSYGYGNGFWGARHHCRKQVPFLGIQPRVGRARAGLYVLIEDVAL